MVATLRLGTGVSWGVGTGVGIDGAFVGTREGAVVADDSALHVEGEEGAVNGRLQTVAHLQAALDVAAASNSLVVLKFVRAGCAACASTREDFAATAKRMGSTAQFFEVDYDASRPFCRACKVKFVPAAHIYTGAALAAALPIGKKSWSAFAEKLEETAAAL